MEPLWVVGAFVTSLLYSGLMVLIVFLFFRLRSRLILFFLISVAGSLIKLIGEINRLMPDLRLLGSDCLFGCGILLGSGIGLVTFGAPNLAVELTAAYGRKRLSPLIAGYACLVAALTGIGIGTSRPQLAAAAYVLEYAAGMAAGIHVLARGSSVRDPRVRLLSRIIAGFTAALLPFCIAQQILRFRRHGFAIFGTRLYPQAVLLFLVAVTTLLFVFRYLARTARTHREALDADLVRRLSITPRERDIIIRIAEGDSNDEISARLFISESTVKNHIYHIYKKAKVHSRVELLNAVLSNR